jgi:hypothetical protein
MSLNSIPIDLDKYKLLELFERYQQKKLSHEEAIELKPLIERIWEYALEIKDFETADQMSTILIALNAYIAGRISLYNPPKIDRVSVG